MSGKCLILRGPTNCFKSTFASNFDSSCIVSIDRIRKSLVGTSNIFTEEFSVNFIVNITVASRLNVGLTTVIDATNIPFSTVKRFVDMCKIRHANVLIYSFIRETNEIISGNAARCSGSGDRSIYVPEDVICGQVLAYKEETPLIIDMYEDIFTEFNISDRDVSEVYNKLLSSFKE